jgi:hypothetical protein
MALSLISVSGYDRWGHLGVGPAWQFKSVVDLGARPGAPSLSRVKH